MKLKTITGSTWKLSLPQTQKDPIRISRFSERPIHNAPTFIVQDEEVIDMQEAAPEIGRQFWFRIACGWMTTGTITDIEIEEED